ncbi:Peroxidase 12 [Hordeum vulgare]|nr:Peroxidase 12 [Hordeum vulgare]
MWKAQVLPPLRIANVTGYIDGTLPTPARFLPPDDKDVCAANREYTTWYQQDQNVLNYLLASLTGDVLHQVIRKGNLSMVDYFAKICANADKLAVAGRPMQDDDTITIIITASTTSMSRSSLLPPLASTS